MRRSLICNPTWESSWGIRAIGRRCRLLYGSFSNMYDLEEGQTSIMRHARVQVWHSGSNTSTEVAWVHNRKKISGNKMTWWKHRTQDCWNLWNESSWFRGCFMQLPGMWPKPMANNLMINGIYGCPSTGTLSGLGRPRSCSARSSNGRWIFLLDALGVAVNLSC